MWIFQPCSRNRQEAGTQLTSFLLPEANLNTAVLHSIAVKLPHKALNWAVIHVQNILEITSPCFIFAFVIKARTILPTNYYQLLTTSWPLNFSYPRRRKRSTTASCPVRPPRQSTSTVRHSWPTTSSTLRGPTCSGSSSYKYVVHYLSRINIWTREKCGTESS